jgi:hypothetical protein
MSTAAVFAILLIATCLLAFARGGRDERWGATITLLAALLTPLVQIQGFVGPEVGIFAVDLMLLMMLGQLAIASDRYWPMAATAFQLNTLSIHLLMMLFPTILPEVYADVTVFWAFPIQIAIIFGVLAEQRQVPE